MLFFNLPIEIKDLALGAESCSLLQHPKSGVAPWSSAPFTDKPMMGAGTGLWVTREEMGPDGSSAEQ